MTENRINMGEGWEAIVYRKWDFPSDVVDAWNSISAQYGDIGIFLSYDWFENWWKAFGKSEELFVSVLSGDGVIRAIFPCRISNTTNRLQEITFLTNDHTFFNDFIVDHACRRTALGQFMRLIKDMYPDSQLFIDSMSMTGCGFDAFTAELHQKRVPFQTYSHSWAPWTPVSGNITAYQKQLPRKRTSDLKRCRLKAEKQGMLNLDIIRHSDTLDAILDIIFELEYKSWKGRDCTAIKCAADVEMFYRGIAHWAMKNGNLHIFILKIGNRNVSMNFCLNSGMTMYCLKVGYDESFKNLSPGNLLYWEMFKYLFDSPDINAYNFMGACEPWKMEWTPLTNEYGWIRVYPKTITGTSQYIMKYGWKSFLKRFDVIKRIKTYIDRKSTAHA